ncbi:MAG: hypothetical protein FJW35_03055 [Acidobacteria bacterium]|nr:hypothetical protein [Acidobacteriota bacterium]
MSPKTVTKQSALIRCFLGLALLFPLAAYSQHPDPTDPQESTQAQAIEPSTAQKLTLANGYHELALLWIKKGEPDRAAAEARKILELLIPQPFSRAVAESLSIITNKMAETGRYDLGQALLDEAVKVMEQASDKVKILQTKARLYMLAGENDKAIESWRRALELEARRVP